MIMAYTVIVKISFSIWNLWFIFEIKAIIIKVRIVKCWKRFSLCVVSSIYQMFNFVELFIQKHHIQYSEMQK